MNKPAEKAGCVKEPDRDHVDLEDRRDSLAGHQRRIWLEDEYLAEVGGDRLAVVDRVGDVDQGRDQSRKRSRPQGDRRSAGPCWSWSPHPQVGEAAVHQGDESDQDGDARRDAAGHSQHVVGVFGNADRVGPGSGIRMPSTWPPIAASTPTWKTTGEPGTLPSSNSVERAVQPNWSFLRRQIRPPIPITSHVGQDDADRGGRGTGRDQTQLRPPIIGRGNLPGWLGMTSGGANGSMPTSSLGRPSSASRLIR